MKVKIITSIVTILSINSYAQLQWQKGGNGATPPAAQPIIGTDASWNSSLFFHTFGQNRMALWGNTGSPSTPFGGGLSINLTPANPILVPKSLLTIGEDADGIGEANSGWRAWMKVGTFNQGGSDLAYFGLKNEGSGDRNDAVIAWGDDRGLINSPNQFAPDYFRFIFTSDYGTGTDLPNDPQGTNSLEIARLSPFGSMGIGNYYNHPLFPITKEPARRLEILSDKTTATGNGSPLIRLTHTQQNPNAVTSTGKFSEFEPRNNGNLFISVRDNTQINNTTRNLKERFVGINTNNAGNTLEINSQLVSASTQNGFTGSSSANATGWSGLRFTDLKSSSIPQANGNGIDNTKVLSVDQNGDVVLVDGGGCKTTLVKTTAFTGNANGCPNGGVMLEYGVDTNCNNILDANEVNALLTKYVCNGTNGISGTNGTNGLNSLSSSTPFSGSLGGCTNGGVKVEFGLDTSNDGILQASEITQTQYVCNGLNGAPGPTGPAGGVVNANNGLSITSSNIAVLGQSVGQSGNPAQLINDRQVPLNNNTVLFNGDGKIKLGKYADLPITAGEVATMEVENSFSANNVGLLIKDKGQNGAVNRQGLKIVSNLNNGDVNTAALNVEADYLSNGATSNAWLVKVKGADSDGNGSNDECFNINAKGHAGFFVNNQADLAFGAVNIHNRKNQAPQGNANTNYGGVRTLMITNEDDVIGNPNIGAEIFSKNASDGAIGLVATARGESINSSAAFHGGIGVIGKGISNAPLSPAFGLQGIGETGTLNNGSDTYGARLIAQNSSNHNYGVYSTATGSGQSYGGWFEASGSSTYNIGILAKCPSPNPSGSVNNYAGFFLGDVYISGVINPSDAQLKQNQANIVNASDIIKQLHPKTFDYKHANFPSMNLPQGLQYGLIAQEVEQVLPALVSNNSRPAVLDSTGNIVTPAVNFKGLEYQQLIPILIQAVKEQQSKIDSLQTVQSKQDSINQAVQQQLVDLVKQINACCSNSTIRTTGNNSNNNVTLSVVEGQKTINSLDVELSDKDAVVLNQNVPNPFAEQTTITYNVPANVGKAQLLFYNAEGKIIHTVDITTRGKGKINVFANDLSSGLYHYTLVVDGKVADSKKMVRE